MPTQEERLGYGFINLWTRSLEPEDVDRLIEAHGNLPGKLMGSVFSMMTPMRTLTKYNLDLLEVIDDEKKLLNFLRMEKWIADRPHHPGEAAKQWLKDLYQDNKLVKASSSSPDARSTWQHHHAGAERVRQGRPHHPAGDHAGAGPASAPGTTRTAAAGRACRRLRRRHVQAVSGPGIGDWLAERDPQPPAAQVSVAACSPMETSRPTRPWRRHADGDTVCTSGFVGIGTPDELIPAPSSAASSRPGSPPA